MARTLSIFMIISEVSYLIFHDCMTTHTYKTKNIEVLTWLIEYFPSTFFKQPHHIKPLKIGIFNDLSEFYNRLDNPPFSKKRIREALNYYSASKAYLKKQTTGQGRIDLYGRVVDTVTEDQALYAKERLRIKYPNRPDHADAKPSDN